MIIAVPFRVVKNNQKGVSCMVDFSEIKAASDRNKIAQAASICYLVREYCMGADKNEFFNAACVADAMEVAHDLLTNGENI